MREGVSEWVREVSVIVLMSGRMFIVNCYDNININMIVREWMRPMECDCEWMWHCYCVYEWMNKIDVYCI